MTASTLAYARDRVGRLSQTGLGAGENLFCRVPTLARRPKPFAHTRRPRLQAPGGSGIPGQITGLRNAGPPWRSLARTVFVGLRQPLVRSRPGGAWPAASRPSGDRSSSADVQRKSATTAGAPVNRRCGFSLHAGCFAARGARGEVGGSKRGLLGLSFWVSERNVHRDRPRRPLNPATPPKSGKTDHQPPNSPLCPPNVRTTRTYSQVLHATRPVSRPNFARRKFARQRPRLVFFTWQSP